MPALHNVTESPYTPQQLFDLVADVERYPEFLPWCRAVRMLERGEGWMRAEMIVHFKALSESYVSRVTLRAPRQIDVVMESGPFEHLTNGWEFVALEGGGTAIHFSLDFRFRSKLLEKMIGGLFTKAQEKMAEAFKKRADDLYGKPPSQGS